jgi:anti-anti-sigma factor
VTGPGTNNSAVTWHLDLVAERTDGALRLTVWGRLGSAGTASLVAALTSAIASGDRHIVLDLRGLDYINSAGIMALEVAAARLRTDGGGLVLSNLTPPVRLALELAGFPTDVEVTADDR